MSWKTKKKKIEMRDSEERDKENKTKDLGSQSKLASRKPCLYSQSRFPQSYFFSTVLARYQNIWVSPWSMGNLSESYQSYCDHTLSLPPLYSLFSFSLSKRKKNAWSLVIPKYRTMTRSNAPDMSPKRTKKKKKETFRWKCYQRD